MLVVMLSYRPCFRDNSLVWDRQGRGAKSFLITTDPQLNLKLAVATRKVLLSVVLEHRNCLPGESQNVFSIT